MMVGRLLPGVVATAGCRRRARGRDLPCPSPRHRQARIGGSALIAKLTGVVDSIDEGSAVIDVNGVGYLVSASSRTLRDLGGRRRGDPADRDHVREDAIDLYGFLATAERDWFRLLTTVQGVGARVALSILSTLSPDELARAIAAGDKASLSRPAGVGPKLAARLVTELKDKAGRARRRRPHRRARPTRRRPRRPRRSTRTRSRRWSISAIAGPRRSARSRACARLGADAPLDALIRAGLQELAR